MFNARNRNSPYRVRNLRKYNAALVGRGSLTLWLDESAVEGSLHAGSSGRRGASLTYSDAAITAVLLLKAVYRLPLRGAQGLVGSVLQWMHLDWPVPHYSTLSRRQASLQLDVPRLGSGPSLRGQSMHLVVDSTGCKVYGEGKLELSPNCRELNRDGFSYF